MLLSLVLLLLLGKKEQLLLSVLPEHVAVKMRQDLGTAHDGQFKKIYMSRHENVRLVHTFFFFRLFNSRVVSDSVTRRRKCKTGQWKREWTKAAGTQPFWLLFLCLLPELYLHTNVRWNRYLVVYLRKRLFSKHKNPNTHTWTAREG